MTSSKPPQSPRTVGDLFPSKYVRPDDLTRPAVVTIGRVDFENFRQPSGGNELKAVLTFRNATKQMILNKTQALAIAKIAGTESFDRWPGVRLQLVKGRAQNGKATIVVQYPPRPMNGTGSAPPPPQAQEPEDEGAYPDEEYDEGED